MGDPLPEPEPKQSRRSRAILRCPVHGAPFLEVVADGLAWKCKSCRGTLHHISRSFLEAAWQALAEGRDPLALPPEQA